MRSILLTTMILQMKQSFARPMFRFCLIANPILNTILLYEMFRNTNEDNFASYVILGAGLMGIWSCICFSSAGDINRERFNGTLSLIFTAPAGFAKVVMAKVLGNTVLSLVSLFISLITASVVYKVSIRIESPVYFIIAFISVIGSFVVISAILASVLTLSRRTTLYMNCLEIPFIMLCGMSFPIEVLPKSVRVISYMLSPTWAIDLLRMSVNGVESGLLFWTKLGIHIVLLVIGCLFSLWLYRVIDTRVRVKASLDVC